MQSISFIDKISPFELLSVFEARYYLGAFKPYTQARIAGEKDGFFFDLMKFERDPDTFSDGHPEKMIDCDSCVGISIASISGKESDSNDKTVLTFLANSVGDIAFYRDGVICDFSAFDDQRFTYKGDDEQGWYWGIRFSLPDGFLINEGFDFLANKSPFLLNVFTFQFCNKEHFGAIQPVNSENLFDINNLGRFNFIEKR